MSFYQTIYLMSTFNIQLRNKDTQTVSLSFFIQRNAALSKQELRNPGMVRLQKENKNPVFILGVDIPACFNACCTQMLSMSLAFQYDTKNGQKPH